MIWIPEFMYQKLPLFYAVSGMVFLTLPPGVVIKAAGVALISWSLFLKVKRIERSTRYGK